MEFDSTMKVNIIVQIESAISSMIETAKENKIVVARVDTLNSDTTPLL